MKIKERIKRTIIISHILREKNPTFSYCEKCGLPWNHCKSKTVMYSQNKGSFATCDVCWNNSTLDELKIYYAQLYRDQENSLIGTRYKMEHTREHLLKCVEKEYYDHLP